MVFVGSSSKIVSPRRRVNSKVLGRRARGRGDFFDRLNITHVCSYSDSEIKIIECRGGYTRRKIAAETVYRDSAAVAQNKTGRQSEGKEKGKREKAKTRCSGAQRSGRKVTRARRGEAGGGGRVGRGRGGGGGDEEG